MTATTPGPARAATARAPRAERGSFLRDTMTVFLRATRIAVRNPVWVIMGLAQPVLYLVLFGPLLKPIVGSFDATNAYQLFVPGLLVQLGIFGALFVGFGLVAEWREGVIESERVTPAPRTALVLGRVLRDVMVIVVQGTLLSAVAVPMGLRAPVGGLVVGVLTAALLGASFASISYALALRLRSEDALAPLLNGVALPILLLSGILLPITAKTAPRWLEVLSDVNPVKHVVAGLREQFLGHLGSGTALLGYGVTIALVVVGLAIGVRTFRHSAG